MASIDFNRYKSEISLPDFLINEYGFRPVTGSSKNFPKLRHPHTDQTFVVKKNNQGNYTYFDVHDGNIKGRSILDFVQSEQSRIEQRTLKLTEVAAILDDYMKSGQFVTPERSQYVKSNELMSQDQMTRIILELEPLKDRSFLYSRGITDETIDCELFKNIIFNKTFKDESGELHTNTVFKMYNGENSVALSQRNEHFKGALGSRANCLCSSNLIDNSKPVDNFIFGESMIDCMSHYQLNKHRYNSQNIIYLSSEGSLADEQLTLFQKLTNVYKPQNITTIFDNDQVGLFYCSKVLGCANLSKEFLEDVKPSIPVSFDLNASHVIVNKGKSDSSLEFIVPVSASMPEISMYFDACLRKANNDMTAYVEPGNSAFKGSVVFESPNQVKYLVEFENSINSWSVAQNIVQSFKFANSKHISIDKPILKDFNDDLKLIKGIHPDYLLKKHDGKLFVFHHDKPLRPYKEDTALFNKFKNAENNLSF